MIRPVAALVAAALVLVACGDDEPDLAVLQDDSPPIAAVNTDEGAVDPPSATVPADLPEEYLPAVGPVEVTGDPLPGYPDVSGPDPAIGLQAPTVVGLDADGEPVRIDAATTGPTMVVFLAHWCNHCNEEVPVLNELGAQGRFPDDLRVVGVATASEPTAPNYPPGEWLAEKGWPYDWMLDGIDVEAQSWTAASAYGVSGFPSIVVIDGDGVVVDRWSGAVGADAITAAVDAALA